MGHSSQIELGWPVGELGVTSARRPVPTVPEAPDLIWDGAAIHFPASAATLRGFRAWATSEEFPDHLRASYIGREVFLDMSPEEFETHNKVKTEISNVVGPFIKRRGLGYFFSDGTLLTNKSAQLSTEPDACFVSWDALTSGRVAFTKRHRAPREYVEMVGAPDWVLEVVSRSSIVKDTRRLRDAYHRAGIPEYWLVDARHEEVSFQILRWTPAAYVAAQVRRGWRRSLVFNRKFALRRERDRLDNWLYTLDEDGKVEE
jgi:Uma2 family endonuclease